MGLFRISLLMAVILSSSAYSSDANCIKIGILGEFKTATGKTMSHFGQEILNGVKLGLRRAKEISPEHCFIPIEIDIRNSISNVSDLIKEASVRQKINVFVGLGISEQALMASKALSETNSILLTPTASSDALNGEDSRIFLMFPRNSKIATTLAESAIKKGIKTVGIILDSTSKYGEDIVASFVDAFQRSGGRILKILSARHAAISSSDVLTLKHLKPDALFLPLFELDAARVLYQLNQEGFLPFIIGADSWGTKSKIIRMAMRGVTLKVLLPKIYGTNSDYPENQKMRTMLFEENKRLDVGDLFAFSYDSILLLNKMIVKCGRLKSLLDKPAVCLRKSMPFSSTTGDIYSAQFLSLDRKIAVRNL